MKTNIKTFAAALFVLAGLGACSDKNDTDGTLTPPARMGAVIADPDFDGGEPQTRISLGNDLKLLWEAGDQLHSIHVDADRKRQSQKFNWNLESGDGTSTAVFTSTTALPYGESGTHIFFPYPGGMWGGQMTNPTIVTDATADNRIIKLTRTPYPIMSDVLTYNPDFKSMRVPMCGIGTDLENIEFVNMCGMLKLNVHGDGEFLNSVKVESVNGEWLSGGQSVTIAYEDGEYKLKSFPATGSSSTNRSVTVESINEPLDMGTALPIYIPVPAQTYNGLKVTFTTSNGARVKQSTAILEVKLSEILNLAPVEVSLLPSA